MDEISILMLEDSPLDAELILARMDKEQIPYKVCRAATEKEFRDAIYAQAFDLILSDFSLPLFSGSDALEIAIECCPDVPFIFVSGALGEEVAIETLKRGATDYVLKHRLERLAPAVKRALAEAGERKRREAAEAGLRQSESRYRLLAEATPIFVWAADEDGGTTFVNRQFSNYTGVSFEETLAGNWRGSIHPDDLDVIDSAWDDALRTRESFEFEFRCRRASDGAFRWHLARVIPLPDEKGAVWHWLGTALDIETQKQAETALRRSNEELQQFAFAASHDLQEPLRNISTFTQLLARRFEHQLDAEADEYIRYAVDGAKRMNSLIHDLLSYARISMQDVPRQRVRLDGVFSSVLDSLRMSIAESDAAITHDSLPEVTANAMQIFQVIQNLLSNAIKYRNSDRQLRIHFGVGVGAGEWIFSVRDNGQGFDQSYADRVFGVFHRLHGRDVPGTGIGLSICKRIIERHDGRIWAQSIRGQGSTFYFTLPALRESHPIVLRELTAS